MEVPSGLYVVLVNYRRWRDALRTVAYLKLAGLAPEQVLIVDCGSGDGSVEQLCARHPAESVLALAENLGFAGGSNRGATEALARGAASLLFLNTDTAFGMDFLTRLQSDAAPGGGAALSPEIFWAGQTQRPWFAGGWRGRLPGTLRLRALGDACTDVDYLWACCLWVDRATWQAVGPFDEGYFLYYEDMEWCERAAAMGVGRRVVPGARLWHSVGASTGGPDTALRRYHLTRSSQRFFRRHGPAAVAMRGLLDSRTAMRLAARGRRDLLAAHLAGWRDGAGLP